MPESGDQGSDSNKAYERREILRDLIALTDEDCEQLLRSLHEYYPYAPKGRAGDAVTKSLHPTRSLDDYMSQLDDDCNEEVQSQLYEEAKTKEVQQKAHLANKYGGSNPTYQPQS